MKALLLKLSTMDSETEAALRVIAYFDALAMRSATAEMIVRGAAAIAEAPAGLALPDGTTLRFDSSGARLSGRAPQAVLDEMVGGVRAWIERTGDPNPLDALVLERFALVATTASRERPIRQPTQLSDPSSLELILSGREPLAERSVALRRLGLSPDAASVLIAVALDDDEAGVDAPVEELLHQLASTMKVRGARLGPVGAVIAQPPYGRGTETLVRTVRELIAGSRVAPSARARFGIGVPGAALEAPTGWESARTALRFARRRAAGSSIVDADELGPIAHLAQVGAERWMSDPRVRALRELAGHESGELDLEVLEAYLSLGTLRTAGQSLHMHHSSVASRLARLEERLDLDFTLPSDLFQARLCMYAATLVAHTDGS